MVRVKEVEEVPTPKYPCPKIIEVNFPEEFNKNEEKTWSVKVRNTGATGHCILYFSVKSRPGGKFYVTPQGENTMEVPDYPVIVCPKSKYVESGKEAVFSGTAVFDTAGDWVIVIGSGHMEPPYQGVVVDDEKFLNG